MRAKVLNKVLLDICKMSFTNFDLNDYNSVLTGDKMIVVYSVDIKVVGNKQ